MDRSQRLDDWTRGDGISRVLIDLAADRGFPSDFPVRGGLVELGQRHGLVGLLADHTDNQLVRAIVARESARRNVLKRHLGRVLTRFHDAGIQAVVLKGPAIAERYKDPGHRPFGDLDLLVPVLRLDDALSLLAEDEAVAKVPPKGPKADKRDILFRDPTSGVSFNVDLHWDLFSYSQLRGTARGATEAALTEARQRTDSPLGLRWDIPDPFRIAFLAAHAVLDHRFRLILLRDFLEIARNGGIDWARLEEIAFRWGLRSTTFLALWMSKQVLGAPVPDDFLAAVKPRSAPLRFLQWRLPRVDLVRFDGHRPHPVNLAAVLLNDSPAKRLSLLVRAPAAFPGWRRRVAEDGLTADSPRTLIVVSTDQRRGAEVFTERLRDGLTAKGWVVEAVALRGHGTEPRADVEPLVETVGGETGRFEREVSRELRAKIKSFQPDMLIANGGATLRYGLAAKVGQGCRLAYVSIGEPRYWIRSRFSRWANRLMLRRTDKVLAVSDETRRQLLELEPRLDGRTHTTYTGVPEALFALEHTVPQGPLRLLMVGSLTAEKDPATALRALSGIDNAVLRFVGDGPLLGDLRTRATQMELADRVEFAGSVSDVVPHLEWAHVLILTSRSEGLPGAILEAGAAAVPTVALDVGGVREAVVDGESGLVVDDAEGLVDALRMLDADRELLTRMGKAARQHIGSRFALNDVIDVYAKLLLSLWR